MHQVNREPGNLTNGEIKALIAVILGAELADIEAFSVIAMVHEQWHTHRLVTASNINGDGDALVIMLSVVGATAKEIGDDYGEIQNSGNDKACALLVCRLFSGFSSGDYPQPLHSLAGVRAGRVPDGGKRRPRVARRAMGSHRLGAYDAGPDHSRTGVPGYGCVCQKRAGH